MRDDHRACRTHQRCCRGHRCGCRSPRDHPDRRAHLAHRAHPDRQGHHRVRPDLDHDRRGIHRVHPVHRDDRPDGHRDEPVHREHRVHPVHQGAVHASCSGWVAAHRAHRSHGPCPSQFRRGCCRGEGHRDVQPGAGRQGPANRRGYCPGAGRQGGHRVPAGADPQVHQQDQRPEPGVAQRVQREPRAQPAAAWSSARVLPDQPNPHRRQACSPTLRQLAGQLQSSSRLPSWRPSSPASRRPQASLRRGVGLPAPRWWMRRSGRIRPSPAIWQGLPCSRLRAL